jgi:GTP-dependent phosphoenolpyruvate carboxykinase
MEELLRVDPAAWTTEIEDTRKFLEKFGKRLPAEILEEHKELVHRFERTLAARK